MIRPTGSKAQNASTNNVVFLETVRRSRHENEAATAPLGLVDAPANAKMHAISYDDGNTLRALWRRFSGEAEQLMGFMEKVGIGSPHSREFRRYVHLIKADILAARIIRDQSKP